MSDDKPDDEYQADAAKWLGRSTQSPPGPAPSRSTVVPSGSCNCDHPRQGPGHAVGCPLRVTGSAWREPEVRMCPTEPRYRTATLSIVLETDLQLNITAGARILYHGPSSVSGIRAAMEAVSTHVVGEITLLLGSGLPSVPPKP